MGNLGPDPAPCHPQVKGEARAFAIEAKARADAEQVAKKAEAFRQYSDAAMADMLLQRLPEVGPGPVSIGHTPSTGHMPSVGGAHI